MIDYDAAARAAYQAQQDREFARRVSNMPGQVLKDSATDAAVYGATTTAIALGMFFNERFRYFVQALLHLPMSFFAVFVAYAFIDPTISEGDLFRNCVIGALIWTGLYIALRTIPKWRNA